MIKPESSQSSGCKHIHQTSKKMLMATVFWDMKAVLIVEFMQQWTTIMSEVYCKTLKKLRRAIENKRCEMLISSVLVMLLHIQLLALEH
jgi:hypothetical protein